MYVCIYNIYTYIIYTYVYIYIQRQRDVVYCCTVIKRVTV